MALDRIEILEGHADEHKRAMMEAVHDTLVDVLAVPPGDPTLRVIEHRRAHVMPTRAPHAVSERWTLVEITLFAGRSQRAKRRLYGEIVHRLGELGVPAQDITIVLVESPPENWGVRGGRPATDVELGFTIEM